MCLLALALALVGAQDPWTMGIFLYLAVHSAITAIYWRGQWLNVAEDALELSWRSHKLVRLNWTQLALVDVSLRGHLVLRDRGQVLRVDPSLVGFDCLCTTILRKASLEAHFSPRATLVLLRGTRLPDEELLQLYGPRFLAEPGIHAYLWDPQIDPYASWQAIATTLSVRWRQAGRRPCDFVLAWQREGRVALSLGGTLPGDCRAWARVHQRGECLQVEVDYSGFGPRIYEMVPG